MYLASFLFIQFFKVFEKTTAAINSNTTSKNLSLATLHYLKMVSFCIKHIINLKNNLLIFPIIDGFAYSVLLVEPRHLVLLVF